MADNKNIVGAYVGTEEVSKIYLGTDLLYEATSPEPEPQPIDYSQMPFTIEAISAGDVIILGHTAVTRTYAYSINGGEPVEFTLTGGSYTIATAAVGDVITITSPNDQDGPGVSSNQYIHFTDYGGLRCKVYGNILSLCYADYQNATTLPNIYCFTYLFTEMGSIVDAENLVIPIADKGYCCYSMFRNCSNITIGPELPATTLSAYSYSNMFNNCTALTSVTKVLPATALPSNCYSSMFTKCSSLTTAPELPATTRRGYGCCSYMFNNCTSLNYIKCLFTTTSYCSNWLAGVSATGTFVKDTNTTWPSGVDGIPTGWTVVNA